MLFRSRVQCTIRTRWTYSTASGSVSTLLLGRDHLLLGGGCSSLTALSTRVLRLVSGSHRGMKCGQLAHHLLIEILLVCMYSLRMLTKIVKTRELLSAVTAERSLASMFSIVTIRKQPSARRKSSRERATSFVQGAIACTEKGEDASLAHAGNEGQENATGRGEERKSGTQLRKGGPTEDCARGNIMKKSAESLVLTERAWQGAHSY